MVIEKKDERGSVVFFKVWFKVYKLQDYFDILVKCLKQDLIVVKKDQEKRGVFYEFVF